MDLSEISFSDMITEAKREVAMRERVYARRVREDKMSQQQADAGIATMKAIQLKLEYYARQESDQGDFFNGANL